MQFRCRILWLCIFAYLLINFSIAAFVFAQPDSPPGNDLRAIDNAIVAEDGKQVRFPDKLVGPTPVTGATLTPDINYIIESEVDGVVLARPIGLVKVTKETGPLRIRGRFIDSPAGGKIETRTYRGPNIFIVDALGTGTVDLSFIPFGFKSEADISSRIVPVDNGVSPKPPPDPDPNPKPDPPTPQPKADSLWVIIVEETAERRPETIKVLNDFTYWNNLRAKGHLVRIYDKDQDEAKTHGYVRRAESVGLPAVLLYDQKSHAHLKTFKLPSTTTAIDTEIKGVSK